MMGFGGLLLTGICVFLPGIEQFKEAKSVILRTFDFLRRMSVASAVNILG